MASSDVDKKATRTSGKVIMPSTRADEFNTSSHRQKQKASTEEDATSTEVQSRKAAGRGEKQKDHEKISKSIEAGRVETVSAERLNDRLTGYLLRREDTDQTDDSLESPAGINCNKFSHWCINMKCTDGALATFSFLVGIAAILLQIMSLGSDHWLYTLEPRTVGNVTDNNNELRDFLFQYNSGYWRICRERYVPNNENATVADVELFATEPEFRLICHSWNRPPNGTDDHTGFSKVSGAVLNRILLSAILHIISLAMTGLALGLSVPGHIRRDKRTFAAAILYILSGIQMSIAVMEYICVVDDEMGPKKKPGPDGEESKYKHAYGWSYVTASMSFMCIETCALVELLLFLRRFPSLEDKMSLVPGLKEKIRRAVFHHEFDETLPTRTCSRTSPRISFSYSAENATETAFSDTV